MSVFPHNRINTLSIQSIGWITEIVVEWIFAINILLIRIQQHHGHWQLIQSCPGVTESLVWMRCLNLAHIQPRCESEPIVQ